MGVRKGCAGVEVEIDSGGEAVDCADVMFYIFEHQGWGFEI